MSDVARAQRLTWSPDDIEFGEGAELAFHFNPLQPRNARGEWTRAGEAVSALMPGTWHRGESRSMVYDLPAAQGTAEAPGSVSVAAAGFKGPLAAKVHLGGDQQYWGELAAALNSIPAPLQQRMTTVIGRIELHHEIPKEGDLAGTPGSLAGEYNPGEHGFADDDARGKGNGLLRLRTEPGNKGTVLHESMHALDEADGWASDKLKWRFLALKIRHAMGRRSAPEFQSDGTGNDSRRSAEELWAELASQILGGSQHFDLDPSRGGYTFFGGGAIVPPKLEAEVRGYFRGEGVTPP